MAATFLTDYQIERLLSSPTGGAISAVRDLEGDYMVLGVGGKMGTTLAVMLRRALDTANRPAKVYGVSRFTRADAAVELADSGVHPIACDLADEDQVAALPVVDNVLFLAGQKFGTDSAPEETWVQNTLVPSYVAKHFKGSRIVVFSTGCVYPFVPVGGTGATETTPVGFTGEYASTCVGRERIFTHFARKFGSRQLMFRLSYAVELRYGVLLDIGQKVLKGETVDLTVPALNLIWQGDACARAIECLRHVDNPPRILNVTGPASVTVQHIAEEFGRQFRKPVRFGGTPAESAWLADARASIGLFGSPARTVDEMIALVADHLRAGGEQWHKPTHFEARDGRF